MSVGLALLVGCGAPPLSHEPNCAWDDVTLVAFEDADIPARELADGDRAALWPAIQGGFILPFGARIEGARPDEIVTRAALYRDDTDDLVLETEQKGFTTLLRESPPMVQTDQRSASHFVHLRICPAYMETAATDVTFRLEAELQTNGCQEEMSVRFTPTCDALPEQHRTRCDCECAPEFGTSACAP